MNPSKSTQRIKTAANIFIGKEKWIAWTSMRRTLPVIATKVSESTWDNEGLG